jgi:hypothetical protein
MLHVLDRAEAEALDTTKAAMRLPILEGAEKFAARREYRRRRGVLV